MAALALTVIDNFIWRARLVRAGENYGLNNCLTHEGDDPLVEFYDGRYDHTEFGQFVARYSMSTLLGHEGGLCLDGGVSQWSLSEEAMGAVLVWLKGFPEAATLRHEAPFWL